MGSGYSSAQIGARLSDRRLSNLKVKHQMQGQAEVEFPPSASNHEELAAFMHTERQSWARMIRNADIRPE